MSPDRYKLFYALSLAWQLGFLIAVPIVLFLFLGFLMDELFHAGHFFLLAGLFVAIGTTGFEVYHLLEPIIGKNKKDAQH